MTALAAATSATWVLTRGSGVVSLILLTVTLVLGIVDVSRWRTRRWPRFVIDALHRNVALLAVVFLAVHVATTVLDSFTSVGVIDAFVPFAGSYQPLWIGLGALSLDLLAALVASSLLRSRIGHRAWRTIHWAAYACWPLALIHAIGAGTDASTTWMLAVAIGCTAAVAAALTARIAQAAGSARRAGAAVLR